jgi:hypothetical protein
MIFKARFPIFLREVRPPGFRNQIPAVLFLDTTVDIQELSSSDAPLALHATSEHFANGRTAEFEFRFMEGRFYRPLSLRPDDFEGGILQEPWYRSEGLRRLVDEVYLDVLPHQKKAYPIAIMDILKGQDRPGMNQMAFIRRSARTEIGDQHEAHVDAARVRFNEACSSYVLIDGNVWQECMEPLLSIEMDPQSPDRGKISIFSGELPAYAPLLAREYPASSVQLFSFGELETVRCVADKASMPKTATGPGFSVEFHEPFYFSNDFPYIQDGVRMLSELQTDGEVPKDLIVRVAEFLANDANWTYDGVEELLHDCLSAAKPMSDIRLVVPSLLERLRNRPISLDMEDRQPSFRLR